MTVDSEGSWSALGRAERSILVPFGSTSAKVNEVSRGRKGKKEGLAMQEKETLVLSSVIKC